MKSILHKTAGSGRDMQDKVKIMLVVFLSAFQIFFFVQISSAQDHKIKFATGEWIPFTSAKMEGKGEFTQLVTIVLKEMKVTPEYVFYPWRRCFDAVVKGRVWAAFPYSYTPERAAKVWYSDALSCSKTRFFYYEKKGSTHQYIYNNLQDLKKYRLGGVTGYFYEESFQKAGLHVDYANKEINAIKKLKRGRVDLVPMNELVGWDIIRTHFPDDVARFRTIKKPLSVSPLRLIISKTYPDSKDLLDQFNNARQRAIQKGRLHIEKCSN